MSSEGGIRRHIKIPTENIRKDIKKSNRKPPPTPKKENESNGKELLKQLEKIKEYCNKKDKIIQHEDCVLMIESENDINFSDEAINRLGFNFSFQLNETSAIVTIENESLSDTIELIQTYIEKNKLRSYINKIVQF